MTLFDHFLIFLLFVVQPFVGWFNFRRYLKKIAEGEDANRVLVYRQNMLLEWTFLLVLMALWFGMSRSLADLGFVAAGGSAFWICAAIVAAGSVALFVAGKRSASLSEAERNKHRRSLGELEHFLPQTDRELRSFYQISVTAGIVEEIIFRGFVLWYLSQFMGIWPAIIVSSIAFGLGHSYQGLGGILRTGLVGFAFGVLFVVSGSIWLPILGHILLDVLQGWQLRELYRKGPDAKALAEA